MHPKSTMQNGLPGIETAAAVVLHGSGFAAAVGDTMLLEAICTDGGHHDDSVYRLTGGHTTLGRLPTARAAALQDHPAWHDHLKSHEASGHRDILVVGDRHKNDCILMEGVIASTSKKSVTLELTGVATTRADGLYWGWHDLEVVGLGPARMPDTLTPGQRAAAHTEIAAAIGIMERLDKCRTEWIGWDTGGPAGPDSTPVACCAVGAVALAVGGVDSCIKNGIIGTLIRSATPRWLAGWFAREGGGHRHDGPIYRISKFSDTSSKETVLSGLRAALEALEAETAPATERAA